MAGSVPAPRGSIPRYRWGGMRKILICLAFLLVGPGLGCRGSSSPPPAAEPGPDLGDRAAWLLGEAIRRSSVNPPGDERPVAQLLVDELRRAGLAAQVIDTPSDGSAVGRAAAWGRLLGSGDGAPLILLSHIDVVSADRAAWSTDPFSGERRDGFVHGRGALDAKGVSIVHLLVLTELARRGISLDRDLIFLATPDEESGGRGGAGYLVRERPGLLGGARYLLTEGGGVLLTQGRPAWRVSITEKSPCWIRLVATGTPGHSSLPRRDASVPRLVAALERVRTLRHPLRVLPEVARMYRAMAPLAARENRAAYADLARALEDDPGFRSRFLARGSNAALVHDTLNITVLEGSPRTNVMPSRAVAHLDARLLPGGSCDAFTDQVRGVVADPGIRVDTLLSFPSVSSSDDTPLFRAIEQVASEVDPEALIVPNVGIGFTDAHYFRDLGITSYGFVPRWLTLDEARRVHGPDERISLENLERGVTTLIQILQQLDDVEDGAGLTF